MPKAKAPKVDWKKPLPRVLVIPRIATLRTIGDVRELIDKHMPTNVRKKGTWEYVTKLLNDAATGESTVEVFAALQMVLTLERIEFEIPKSRKG